jgi:hypothetical protein
MFLTGSLVGPVMIRPLESVLTAVVKNLSWKGASGGVSKILRSKGAEKVWLIRVAPAEDVRNKSHPPHAAQTAAAARIFNFLPMFVLP